MKLRGSARARLSFIAASLLAASASAPAAPGFKSSAALSVQQGLPRIVSLDGKPIPQRQLRGKIVLINFWATWCAACREELPSLERLAAKRHDLTVIAASVDTDRRDAVRAFGQRFRHLQLSFASLDSVQHFGALGMPYSVVLNRDGREAARIPRALNWESREAADFLAR